jgi:hypothetical protein
VFLKEKDIVLTNDARRIAIDVDMGAYEEPVAAINPLTPNDHYSGRTALLTSKVAFYIFIQQI